MTHCHLQLNDIVSRDLDIPTQNKINIYSNYTEIKITAHRKLTSRVQV